MDSQSPSKNYVRQQAALAAWGLPPKPSWLPEDATRVWRLLWRGRGAAHFRQAWVEGPAGRNVRLLLSRAICCGWDEPYCAQLVRAWLQLHGLPAHEITVFLNVDFYRELEIVRQYLGRRGVLEKSAEKHRLQELKRVERWRQRTATRVLRFLSDRPGCRRAEIQRGLGVKVDALKRQLQRLERDGLVERSGAQGRYRTTEKGQRFLDRLDARWYDLGRGRPGTFCG